MFTSPVLITYFSVESVELAVSPEHKMFPLVEQNFNSEELQTGETHTQEILAVWPSVFAIQSLLDSIHGSFSASQLPTRGRCNPLVTKGLSIFSMRISLPASPALNFFLTGRS